MKNISVFLIGFLFSLGLIVSGMINPEKVINFLDIFGAWDASLAFVMGGAVLVTFIGYRFVLNGAQPIFENEFTIPTQRNIDSKLVAGAALFGIGWGLVGVCPGPAIAGFASTPSQFSVFLAAMLIGMLLHRLLLLKRKYDDINV